MLSRRNGQGRRGWILPLSVLACAALLRGAYLLLYGRDIPLYSVPLVDAKVYAAWAGSIASGDWLSLGEGVFYRAPLYPYLLAAVHTVSGAFVPWAYLLQSLMGLGILLLAWRLGSRLGGEWGGLLTLLLLTLYGPLMAAESKLLTTTPGLFLHLLSVWYALRFADNGSRGSGLAAGIFLGLASLIRPQWLILAALFPVLMADRPRRLLRWWPFAVGVILTIAPVTVRNRVVGQDWVLISSNGGMTFFQGNNEENRSGLLAVVRRFELFGSAVHQRDFERLAAERETGRQMKPSEISSFWTRQGLEFIVSKPGEWLVLEARKLYRIVTSYEYADNYSYYLERDRLLPLRLAFLPFGVILALGVMGALWCRPGRREDRAILASAAIGILSCLIFFVSSRYRMDAVPGLAILGGAALARLPGFARIPGRRRIAGPVVAALVFAASFLPAGLPARSQESISHLQVGNALEVQGKFAEAEAAYRQAIEMMPSNAIAWNSLAFLLDRVDGPEEAIAVLSGAPREPVMSHPLTQYSMGYLHLRLEMDDEAALWLGRAVRGNPLMREAHERLASVHERRRRHRDAEAHLSEAVALGPSRPDLWARLGYSRIQIRDYASAREAYEQVLGFVQDDADAILNLAVCAFHLGELDAASRRLEELGEAVDGDPLALYYRGLLTFRKAGLDAVVARAAASDLGRVREMEPGNFRALYYWTLARYRAGTGEDPATVWEAAWGQEIRGILPELLPWLCARAAMEWGEGLTDGEDAALQSLGSAPPGSTVAARIRSTIAEE